MALGVAVAVVAVAVAGVLGQGNLDHLIRFRNGGLFVHSSAKRQLHHVDLSSGKVDYALPLDAGDYDVVNTGGVTVARNRVTGAATVIDLSDATGKASRALDLDRGAELVAGGGQVFALDRMAGTVIPIDTSGAVPGAPAQVGGPIEGTAAVDAHGRLWAPVPSRGEIVPVDAQRQDGRIVGVAGEPARLADSGVPLDVTVFNREAYGVAHVASGTMISRLGPGAATNTLSYPGQLSFAAVQGEVDGNQLAGLDRANGVVVRIDAGTGRAVPVEVPGRAEGLDPPLQAGNKLIVPDPRRGELLVLDADRPTVRPAVVAVGGGGLDVQVKDGAVVVNAPAGQRAVEVDRDGNVQTIDKYVPAPSPTDASTPPQPSPVRPLPIQPIGPATGQRPLVSVPAQAPGVPLNLSATAGKSQVSLSWQPPSTGAASVTAYVPTGPQGDTPVSAGTLTAVVPAADEVSVAFRIRAVNPTGSSPAVSFPAVTPHSLVPGKVASVQALPVDRATDLAWPAAAANGTTIDHYVITGSNGASLRPPRAATTARVANLVNGTGYTFSVQAVAVGGGAGAPSDPSPAVVPFGPAAPPKAFSVVAQDGAIRAAFNPSSSDGNGRPVDHYETMATAGAAATPPAGSPAKAGSASPLDLPGLTNGTSYSVFVRTVTKAGPGPWSPARTATPVGAAPAACDPATTAVGLAATPTGKGYWRVDARGAVSCFGDATFHGSVLGKPLNGGVVGIVATPTGGGYWLVAGDGGVFTFGDAAFSGSMGGKPLSQPVVGMAATPSGKGYWLVGGDGGVFAFGDAGFHGNTVGTTLNKSIVGMAATPTGKGYWLVGGDGGVFAFGDAPFHGNTVGTALAKPIVGMASPPAGNGYWLVGGDGGVFTFGGLQFYGR